MRTTDEVYRYRFRKAVPTADVREALTLAAVAAESLYGRSRVHLDAYFELDEAARTCVVDGTTDVGRDIARVFTGLLTRTLGEHAFQVERACAETKTEGEQD